MEFKRLEDFSKYKIYSNGDVYREWKSKDVLMKQSLGTNGYYYVSLWHDSKRKLFCIHRLLAMLFIPNPYLKKEVDHINRVKTDNRLENLRWLDRGGQNLNRGLQENNTGYPFITKHINKSYKSGFCFNCSIRRNNKRVLNTGRAKLEDAVEIVRTFLLENMWVLDGYDMDKVNKIKNKYNLNENV